MTHRAQLIAHLKRYSKSRRKAPIYWLLQSPKKHYGLWLYLHRLDRDTLFKALVKYAEPKLRGEEIALEQLTAQRVAASTPASSARPTATSSANTPSSPMCASSANACAAPPTWA